MAAEHAGLTPMNAMMGWTEGVESKNDAVELAKGFISRRYTAVDASWYAVAPFLGGYLWEVHEGGPGKGYIGSVIKALTENPGSKFWFPSGDRAFQVMMRDGKPFGILLSKAESLPVLNSGQPQLGATTSMTRAVKRGTAMFAAGASILASSVAFMAGAAAFYVIAANPGPSLRAVDFSAMPHAQWNLVSSTGVEQVVSKLEFSQGKWNVVHRTHIVPGLKELRDASQASIQKARDSVTPMPVEDPAQPAPAAAPGQPAAAGGPGAVAVPPGGTPPAADLGPIPGFEQMSTAEKRRALRDRALNKGTGSAGAPLPAPVAVPGDMNGVAAPSNGGEKE